MPACKNSPGMVLECETCIFYLDYRNAGLCNTGLYLLCKLIHRPSFNQQPRSSPPYRIEQVIVPIPSHTTYRDKHFARRKLTCVVAECGIRCLLALGTHGAVGCFK